MTALQSLEALVDDVAHRMQVTQSRLIADTLEAEAKKYAAGDLPRVSPQVALEAMAKAIRGMVSTLEAKHGRVPV